jgi:hypothetical protein
VLKDREQFIKQFREADKSDIPDFAECVRPLDMALWVLLVAKDKVGEKRLTGEEISFVIIETQEVSVNKRSVINSLNRASDKVHRHSEKDEVYFEIMKPGREYLSSLQKESLIHAFYFEPDSKYTAKKLLRTQIFHNLTGNLKIIDPYFGERALDVLESIKGRHIKAMTRLENLKDRDKSKLMRELADFKTENPDVEFRNYPGSDIHDRYIISEGEVTLIGHSMKDLGAKETFAVILDRESCREIYEALSDNFDNRWNISAVI